MQELEIVREKIQNKYRVVKTDEDLEWNRAIDLCTNIINAHIKRMNDGWNPVEKEWPPFGQRLQATILHHEWISDYDAGWVPEEEKIHHPEYTEVCEIYPIGEMWCYNCAEDDYNRDIAYIEPAKVLSRPVAEIIAWRHLAEPYRPERSNHNGE